ncbi:VWA domain-containing protein [Lentibacter algarum]|uniref:vWA domain-containing protein n=1 Tax=Lentibacter algarum TaxID=576131 RepID=UPI001C07AB40|nr:vWA domain-containing protein [Lentibacter algarum]MBU2981862.1 VWA domain-containing protein [Lentibacter algarum]
MTLMTNKLWLAGLAGFALTACDAPVVSESSRVDGASASVEAAGKRAAPEADIMIEPMPAPMPEPMSPKRHSPRGKQGVVTAGDIDDTLNFAAFQRYQSGAAQRLGLPRISLNNAVRARLVGPNGKPAAGVPITLTKAGASTPFYSGYSGVDGVVSVFPSVHGAGGASRVELKSFASGQQQSSTVIRSGNTALTPLKVATNAGWKPDFLDLAFVFDTTGSMGDELAWLTKEFQGIVRAAKHAAPGVNIRYGLIAYRDNGDVYKVKNFGFTQSQSEMQNWLRGLNASGGGDYPEAAAEAFEAASQLNWRRGKGERLMFHIADAPAHDNKAKRFLRASEKLAGKNVQIFGLGASGVAKESEFLMRQAALVSGGRYMFLTDDSGVGNSHAEPTIACYKVTKLKELLGRVLTSELTGQRREAKGAIRQVGNYSRGVCSQ